MKFKKKLLLLPMLLLLLSLAGCGSQAIVKIRDLKFTVLDQDQIPQPLMDVIQENLETEMKLSYQNDGKLYIARGFGPQKTGGYSIAVEQCYLGEDGIHVKFQLLGPEKADSLPEEASYPFIVIQTENAAEYIVFE